MQSTFTCVFLPLYVFFGQISIQIFCPFFDFFLRLTCMSRFYMLQINLLQISSFAKIFFHSVDCCFVLFMISFAVQKVLSLIRSHLFIFIFVFITLGNGSKKTLLRFMPQSVLPMFSSKSFIVSHLTLRSLTHFNFIFRYGVEECPNSILLHGAVQFSQHHLLKRLSFFPILCSWPLCHILGDHKCMHSLVNLSILIC